VKLNANADGVKRRDILRTNRRLVLRNGSSDKKIGGVNEVVHKILHTGAEVLMAFKDAGLSNREIAQLLGVSEGTIRYRLRKEREKTGGIDSYRDSSLDIFATDHPSP
jgi:ATP/maltotriose-dependent transcriptional regulator MalT